MLICVVGIPGRAVERTAYSIISWREGETAALEALADRSV